MEPNGGFAIGLDGPALARKFAGKFAYWLGEVEYDEDAQIDRIVSMLDHHLEFHRELQEEFQEVSAEKHLEYCTSSSLETLSQEMLFFKTPAF